VTTWPVSMIINEIVAITRDLGFQATYSKGKPRFSLIALCSGRPKFSDCSIYIQGLA
jgi:hypothetical protein